MPAPTPDEILANGYDLSIFCDGCRLLVAPIDLALALSTSGRGSVPVDQLKFRCTRCRGIGEPLVKASGNLLLGRRAVWPEE